MTNRYHFNGFGLTTFKRLALYLKSFSSQIRDIERENQQRLYMLWRTLKENDIRSWQNTSWSCQATSYSADEQDKEIQQWVNDAPHRIKDDVQRCLHLLLPVAGVRRASGSRARGKCCVKHRCWESRGRRLGETSRSTHSSFLTHWITGSQD